MSTSVRIEGLRQLRDNIARLEKGMQRRVYNKAVKAGGKIILDAAKADAPRDTGTLARALVVRASSKPGKGLFGVKITVKGGFFASQRTSKRRGVGADYMPDAVDRYYRFQELGTKYHPAQPFLEPSIGAKSAEVLAKIKSELEAGLERETRGFR